MEKLTYTHNDAAAKALAAFYETPPLAYVRSYGCQQNVNDGEKIKGVLQDVGYGLCDNVEHADLILFNTCAVREHAEQRVFGNVGALKGLKEKKRGLIIGLCGCMANQKHVVEKLRQSYPYVDLVFGVDGIDTLPQLIAQKLQKHKRVLMEPAQRPVIVENIPIRRESEFRAWLPIMYGCDNFCTYCIVPHVRGRERSRMPEDIIREVAGMIAAGFVMRRLMAADNTVEKRNVKQKRQFKLQQSAVFVGHDCDFHSFLPEKSKRFAHARKSFDHPRHVGFVKFGIFTVSLFRPAAKHQRKIIHERQQFVLLFAGALPVRQPVF